MIKLRVSPILLVAGLVLWSASLAARTARCASAEGIVLDDFESYTDDEPSRLFDIWFDGWDNPANGSVVGHEEAPFAEQEIVHAGIQAMILQYDNSDTAQISETERVLDAPLDVTGGGVMQALSLWYQGVPGSVGTVAFDDATGNYTVTGTGAEIGGFSDALHFAYAPFSGDGTIIARIDSVEKTHSQAMAGVMIRQSLEAGSPHAFVGVTPSGRPTFIFRVTANTGSGVTAGTSAAAGMPHWVKLTRAAGRLTAEHSFDGVNWTPVESADAEDPSSFQIPMQGNLFVGLAVNAHRADGVPAQAVFSNVTINGSLPASPLVDSTDIGIPTNGPAPLYVELGDTSGTRGTVFHEAGLEAPCAGQWTQWAIPLEQFAAAGVDLTAIDTIVLGAGDKGNPQAGGAGVLYFDDIQTIRRMPVSGMALLLEQDFEDLPLGASVDEGVAGTAVWTKTTPAGWTIDDSGVPGVGNPDLDGVTEWAGWSFADKDWWVETAGDQERSQFALGTGTVAIADGDEWDDQDHTPGLLNSFLSTPAINVSGIEPGADTLMLQFDSSWRREDTQTAVITATFDDGEPVEVLRYESEGADTGSLKDDATSEFVTVAFARPAGAQQMVLTFGIVDAGNDWWWAVDNVQLYGVPRDRVVALAEDFEDAVLGPNVEEGTPGSVEEAWTDTPPVGWTIDESGVPGVGDPAVDGVTEWAGWAIAEKEFWIASDGQRREEFTLGQGNVVVADCDEWDDSTHPDGYDVTVDAYDTWLTTPAIDISEFEPGSLQLTFDSSWRPEYDGNYHQTANITASFDGGEPIEILRWESDPTSANFKDDNSTNETIVLDVDNPAGARSVVLTFGLFEAGNDWWWALDNIVVAGLPKEKLPLFTEDFEGLPLGPNVDEALAGDAVWTKTAPEGWTIDDSGVPGAGDAANDGVTEWAGWSFANKDWWVETAGDQERSQFELGVGTVAIIDPDEWDDQAHADGLLDSLLITPAINIAGMEVGSLELTFDSSWRREDTQTASITVSYDGGASIEVARWESEGADTGSLKDDAANETVVVPLNNPAGAETVTISFAMTDAGNDWWWAIDNIVVGAIPQQRVRRVFFSGFEGLALEEPLDEAAPGGPEVWTDVAPEGWFVDDSGVPGAGDVDNDGVTEWAGWSFANKEWWAFVAGDQGRSGFELGSGAVAIADCDEWDDLPHEAGEFNAFMSTPAIDVSGVDAGSVQLTFDSAWQEEVLQTATITASYDGGAEIEVLRWESSGGNPAFFKDHAVSETVTVDLQKPAGARSVVITFGLGRAGNNWFWAVDNLEVSGTAGGSVVSLFTEDFESVPLGAPVDEALPPIGNYWTHTPPAGWINDDSGVPGAGTDLDGVTEWAGWSFVTKDWWVDVAEDQQRSQFILGDGTVAVADPDEWDDMAHADGLFNAFLATPVIDIAGAEAGSLQLLFSSSWRQEDTQTATVTVSYDGGDPDIVLLWESELGDPAFLKADATNEQVTVDLNNPEGAQTVVVTFGMVDAGNDWWWAIDNVEVVGAFSD